MMSCTQSIIIIIIIIIVVFFGHTPLGLDWTVTDEAFLDVSLASVDLPPRRMKGPINFDEVKEGSPGLLGLTVFLGFHSGELPPKPLLLAMRITVTGARYRPDPSLTFQCTCMLSGTRQCWSCSLGLLEMVGHHEF